MSIKDLLKNSYYNMQGFKTSRKIIVIESDDWGSIRVQSHNAENSISKKLQLKSNPFNKVDSLETQEDLQQLYKLLCTFTDINGRNAKITANFVMSNPNFTKIRENNYSEYFYEDFVQSYQTYYNSSDIFKIVQQGINDNIFFPQFHGREHLQTEYWMRDLRSNKFETIEGFNNCFFGFGKNDIDKNGYLSSFNATNIEDLELVKLRIKEGLQIFEKKFGYNSRSVIAPQNTFHQSLLPFFKQLGVDVIQGARITKQSLIFDNDKALLKRFMGRKNAYNQLDIVRNATFEPASTGMNCINRCMQEVKNAFFYNKPVVICSHRHNYMGYLKPENRKNNLGYLEILLRSIQKEWPDIEFLTTIELADYINNTKTTRNI